MNEILSKPKEGNCSFVEVKNYGSTTLSLKGWALTSTPEPLPEDWQDLTEIDWVLPSGSELALASCISWVGNLSNESRVLEVDLPSLQDGRTLQLGKFFNTQSDDLTLDSSVEGVSSERLNPEENNWVLSPQMKGGSSPGRVNYNKWSWLEIESIFEVYPKTLHVDSEGFSWVNIQIQNGVEFNNAVVNIIAPEGKSVCEFHLTPLLRHVIWEGLNQDNYAVSAGTYVVELMLENMSGEKLIMRHLVAVAK
jgi:hypothetical protein